MLDKNQAGGIKRKAENVTEETMAERRQLFLEEMARLRDQERQKPKAGQTLPVSAPPPAPRTLSRPAARPAGALRQKILPFFMVALCLGLVFPIWGYIQHQVALHPPPAYRADLGMPGPDTPEGRAARLERVRARFGIADIDQVQRDQTGMSFVLRSGLSHAEVLMCARRVRYVLSGQTFPPRGPRIDRIGVCSGKAPCTLAVVRRAGLGETWDIRDGERIIK